jgi:hypothetical protein
METGSPRCLIASLPMTSTAHETGQVDQGGTATGSRVLHRRVADYRLFSGLYRIRGTMARD